MLSNAQFNNLNNTGLESTQSKISTNNNENQDHKSNLDLKLKLLAANSSNILFTDSNVNEPSNSGLGSLAHYPKQQQNQENPNQSQLVQNNFLKSNNIKASLITNNYSNKDNINSAIGRNYNNSSVFSNNNQTNTGLTNNSVMNSNYLMTENKTTSQGNPSKITKQFIIKNSNKDSGSNIDNIKNNNPDTSENKDSFKQKVIKNLKGSNLNPLIGSNNLNIFNNQNNLSNKTNLEANKNSSYSFNFNNNSNSHNTTTPNKSELSNSLLPSKSINTSNVSTAKGDATGFKLNNNTYLLISSNNPNSKNTSIVDSNQGKIQLSSLLAKNKQQSTLYNNTNNTSATNAVNSNLGGSKNNHKKTQSTVHSNNEAIFNSYLNTDMLNLKQNNYIKQSSLEKTPGINQKTSMSPGLFGINTNYLPTKFSRNQLGTNINLFNNHTYVNPTNPPNVNVNVSHIRIDLNDKHMLYNASLKDFENDPKNIRLGNLSKLSNISTLKQSKEFNNQSNLVDINNSPLTLTELYSKEKLGSIAKDEIERTTNPSQINEDRGIRQFDDSSNYAFNSRNYSLSKMSNNINNNTQLGNINNTQLESYSNYLCTNPSSTVKMEREKMSSQLSSKLNYQEINTGNTQEVPQSIDPILEEFFQAKDSQISNIIHSMNQKPKKKHDSNNQENYNEDQAAQDDDSNFTSENVIQNIQNYSELKKIFDEIIKFSIIGKNESNKNSQMMTKSTYQTLLASVLRKLNFSLNDNFHRVLQSYNYLRERNDYLNEVNLSKQIF